MPIAATCDGHAVSHSQPVKTVSAVLSASGPPGFQRIQARLGKSTHPGIGLSGGWMGPCRPATSILGCPQRLMEPKL